MITSTLIALGANVNLSGMTLRQTLDSAMGELRESGQICKEISIYYSTPAFPSGSGPNYVNAAARIDSDLPPQRFLALLHQIEENFGRTRETRWGRRTLDLDLIAWGDAVLPDMKTYREWANLDAEEQALRAPERLVAPHPRMHERAFVLVPLNDIAPDWVHPVSGRSVRRMLAGLPQADVEAVKPL